MPGLINANAPTPAGRICQNFFSQSDLGAIESESDPRGGENSNRLTLRYSSAAMTKFNGGFQR